MAQTRLSIVDQTQFPRLEVSDVNQQVTNRYNAVIYKTLTAGRTVTLPFANTYPQDNLLMIADESGNCSAAIPITVSVSGSDNILGNVSVKLTRPRQRIFLFSNGGTTWSVLGLVDEVVTSLIYDNGPLKTALANLLVNTALTGIPTVPTAAAGTNTTQAASTAYVQTAISSLGLKIPVGQCILAVGGTTSLILLPFQGNLLFINGAYYTVPTAGVTLSSTGVVASQLYYVYAYMNGATMTLEYSPTSYVRETTYAHMVKSGDATRTLVGMFISTTANQFTYDSNHIYVRTWFNDPGAIGGIYSVQRWNGSGSNAPGASTSTFSIGNFIAWAGEKVLVNAQLSCVSSGTGNRNFYSYIYFDGNNVAASVVTASTQLYVQTAMSVVVFSLTEGFHYYYITGMNASNDGAVLYYDATTTTFKTQR